MFTLKNEVLDKCLLRRTKDSRAADMELPPRIVSIRTIRLHPIENDFYNALYTQSRASFDDYVAEGSLLNNYAHIFVSEEYVWALFMHVFFSFVFLKTSSLGSVDQASPISRPSLPHCVQQDEHTKDWQQKKRSGRKWDYRV